MAGAKRLEPEHAITDEFEPFITFAFGRAFERACMRQRFSRQRTILEHIS